MTEEFNLSEKIQDQYETKDTLIWTRDVKEFIRRLKEGICFCDEIEKPREFKIICKNCAWINNLTGKELSEVEE